MPDKENRKTILLVEDEALIAMNEKTTLEQEGYNVLITHTGEEAVEAVEPNEQIDLILMDIDLGEGIDGTQAAQEILNEKDIPIVFLSSHTEPAVVKKTEGITSYGYIVKNSGDTVLLAAIKMAFRLYDAHAQLKMQQDNLKTALTKYEQTAEELFEKNEELDCYFASSLDMLCIADTEGNFLRLNPEWEKTLGYPLSELEKHSFMDFVHEEDRAKTLDAINRLEDQKEILSFENRYQCQDGTFRWIEWRSKPLGSTIYAAARDVTERKLAEQQIRESEDRLSKAMAVANDGLWDWDLIDNSVYFDHRYYTMADYAPDEFSHSFTEWEKRVHPDDIEYCKKAIEDHLAGKLNKFDIEFRFQQKDGTWMWIRGQGKIVDRTKDGNPARMVGTHSDITERKVIEKELRLRSQVLDQIKDLVTITDPEGTIIYVNQAETKLTGLPKHEIIGQNITMYGENSDKGTTQDVVLKETLKKGSWHGETINYDANGKEHIMDTYTQVINNDLGEPVVMYSIATDITERKEHEKKIQTLLDEKELILQETHHRIKNNMGVIQSMVSLQAAKQDDRKCREILYGAADRIANMQALYNKLYFAGNNDWINSQDFLGPLIKDLKESYIIDNEIQIDTEIEDIKLNEKKLSYIGIIINELFTNSIKHAFRDISEPFISIHFKEQEGYFTLIYADNGIGLPETLSPAKNGAFGLQLINILVTQLGGKIDTQCNDKTSFIISFK